MKSRSLTQFDTQEDFKTSEMGLIAMDLGDILGPDQFRRRRHQVIPVNHSTFLWVALSLLPKLLSKHRSGGLHTHCIRKGGNCFKEFR